MTGDFVAPADSAGGMVVACCSVEHARQIPMVAVSFLLRDMGNGVDRIERAARVPVDAALHGSSDVERMTEPIPARVADAVEQALLVTAAPGSPPAVSITGIYARFISEHVLNVVALAALLV